METFSALLAICVGNSPLTGDGLSPVRRQPITWANADLLAIGHYGTNFSEIRFEIQNFSFIKLHLKMSSAK